MTRNIPINLIELIENVFFFSCLACIRWGNSWSTEFIIVILQLICSKCMPALLYGLKACPLRLSDYNYLDFIVNRFL